MTKCEEVRDVPGPYFEFAGNISYITGTNQFPSITLAESIDYITLDRNEYTTCDEVCSANNSRSCLDDGCSYIYDSSMHTGTVSTNHDKDGNRIPMFVDKTLEDAWNHDYRMLWFIYNLDLDMSHFPKQENGVVDGTMKSKVWINNASHTPATI